MNDGWEGLAGKRVLVHIFLACVHDKKKMAKAMMQCENKKPKETAGGWLLSLHCWFRVRMSE